MLDSSGGHLPHIDNVSKQDNWIDMDLGSEVKVNAVII